MAVLNYRKTNGATGACAVYTDSADCPAPRMSVGSGFVKLGETNDPAASPLRVHVNSLNKDMAVLTHTWIDVVIDIGSRGWSSRLYGYQYQGYTDSDTGDVSDVGGVSPRTVQGLVFQQFQFKGDGDFLIRMEHGANRRMQFVVNGVLIDVTFDGNGYKKVVGSYKNMYNYFHKNAYKKVTIKACVL